MSDYSISFGQDREDLKYIKKINVHEYFQPSDEISLLDVNEGASEVSLSIQESEEIFWDNPQEVKESMSEPNVSRKLKPFELRWTYGMNGDVGVINLTSETRTEIFYSSGHSLMTFNYCNRRTKYMDGHNDLINCISYDNTGNFLVSTDGDKDGCLIVWSRDDLTPIYTMFSLYPQSGILLAAISPCARFIITIGRVNHDTFYAVNFWLWSIGRSCPDDEYHVETSYGLPVKICYHPDIDEHIMVIFTHQIFLFTWDYDNKKLVPSAIPKFSEKKHFGDLTSGTYLHVCHESYVSTSFGYIMIFRNTLYGRSFEDGDTDITNAKMYINAIKVTSTSIGVLTNYKNILVVGDNKGNIFFYDKSVRILYWLKNGALGPIRDISFPLVPKTRRIEKDKIRIVDKPLTDVEYILDCPIEREEEVTKLIDHPTDAALIKTQFLVDDFFISTSECNVYAFDFLRETCTPIFQLADSHVSCIDCHDEKPYILIGYESGRIMLYDFFNQELISHTTLPKAKEDKDNGVSAIRFSSEALHLVAGRNNGEIWILEPATLTAKSNPEDKNFRESRCKIEKIAFSDNCLQFAVYDQKYTVLLYVYQAEQSRWRFAGKVRSHYGPIHDIRFFSLEDSGSSTLYTIGADRYLVEYNNLELRDESTDKYFFFTHRERIEQTAVPIAFTFYERFLGEKKVGYILLANDQYKLRTIHAATKLPRSLVLGPAYGCFKNAKIKKLKRLPGGKSRYMMFMTNKHIGIHLLPADGNPYKYTGCIAHPVELQNFALSHDGRFVFTYGVNDKCVFQWRINTKSIELLHLIGGLELEPFYCLLEGGKNGWMFQEIQDLFFYVQVLQQQQDINLPRKVSDCIQITEIPSLVRACGFFPSQWEMDNMTLDCRYKEYDDTGVFRQEITFIEFVKLFINFRPVQGYSLEEAKKYFKNLCNMADYPKKNKIDSNDFIYLLQTFGEPSPNLRKNLLSVLRLKPKDDTSDSFTFLPHDISQMFFFHEMLGVDMKEEKSEKEKDASIGTRSIENTDGRFRWSKYSDDST